MRPLKKKDPSRIAREFAEMRSCTRYPFSSGVEAFDIQANTRVMGRLSDISKNGCYMDTICPFAAKADVSLTITKDEQSFTTQAKVVYSQIGMGMGLLFTTAEPLQLRLLGKWLEELGEEVQDRPDESFPELQLDVIKSADNKMVEMFSSLINMLAVKSILSDSERKELLRGLFE